MTWFSARETIWLANKSRVNARDKLTNQIVSRAENLANPQFPEKGAGLISAEFSSMIKTQVTLEKVLLISVLGL